jgi:hypothetical protein
MINFIKALLDKKEFENFGVKYKLVETYDDDIYKDFNQVFKEAWLFKAFELTPNFELIDSELSNAEATQRINSSMQASDMHPAFILLSVSDEGAKITLIKDGHDLLNTADTFLQLKEEKNSKNLFPDKEFDV